MTSIHIFPYYQHVINMLLVFCHHAIHTPSICLLALFFTSTPIWKYASMHSTYHSNDRPNHHRAADRLTDRPTDRTLLWKWLSQRWLLCSSSSRVAYCDGVSSICISSSLGSYSSRSGSSTIIHRFLT